MKTNKFLSIILVALFCYASSCKPEIPDKYPISLGEQTIVGKIIIAGDASWHPTLPPPGVLVLWLATSDGNYRISNNSNGYLIAEDVFYIVGDEVEVTGEATIVQDERSNEVKIMDVKTIRRIKEQNTYTGRIGMVYTPPCFPFYPTEEDIVFCLDVGPLFLALSFDSQLFIEKLIIEDVEYFLYDYVEITGSLSGKLINDSRPCLIFEIETIRKIERR